MTRDGYDVRTIYELGFVEVRTDGGIEDGRRFRARWGDKAEALGWTARDLFGLQAPPVRLHPSYSRLSRYDETGLIWLLKGREVVALAEATAAIQSSSGAITTLPAGTTSRRSALRAIPSMTSHKQTSR
jgi:hypothetical protein